VILSSSRPKDRHSAQSHLSRVAVVAHCGASTAAPTSSRRTLHHCVLTDACTLTDSLHVELIVRCPGELSRPAGGPTRLSVRWKAPRPGGRVARTVLLSCPDRPDGAAVVRPVRPPSGARGGNRPRREGARQRPSHAHAGGCSPTASASKVLARRAAIRAKPASCRSWRAASSSTRCRQASTRLP